MKEKDYSLDKPLRVIALFEQLCRGEMVDKKTAAAAYGVSERTIQRDLEDIHAYCSEVNISGRPLEIEYNQQHKKYMLKRDDRHWLQPAEILAITRILLESRAFPRDELGTMLQKLIIQGEPQSRKHIEKIIANELHHYIPVQHGRSILNVLWDLGTAIRCQQLVRVMYRSLNSPEATERILQPVGMVFSEYYFYLIAYPEQPVFNYPTIYRIDRIEDYSLKTDQFHVPYSKRFEEGEFRKRIQFMQTGQLMKVTIKYWGLSLEAIIDRLPTARVTEDLGDGAYIIEAEVFGKGIKMWFLSQGEFLEVLEPPELRADIKETVGKMLHIYS